MYIFPFVNDNPKILIFGIIKALSLLISISVTLIFKFKQFSSIFGTK